MKNLFHLNKEVTFLNHGSFGACPKAVFEKYQEYQLELENQPVEFLYRKAHNILKVSREALSKFLSCKTDNLVYVTNATSGLNIVANSLDLKAEDEVLSSDIEYGASDRMWEIICERKKAKFIRSQISQPIINENSFTEEIIKNYNENTKVLFLSHITETATGGVVFCFGWLE